MSIDLRPAHIHASRGFIADVSSIENASLVALLFFVWALPALAVSPQLSGSEQLLHRFGYCHDFGERSKSLAHYFTPVFEVDVLKESEKFKMGKDFAADLKENIHDWVDGPSGGCYLFKEEDDAKKDRQRWIDKEERMNEGFRENGVKGRAITDIFDDYAWQPQTADQ